MLISLKVECNIHYLGFFMHKDLHCIFKRPKNIESLINVVKTEVVRYMDSTLHYLVANTY